MTRQEAIVHKQFIDRIGHAFSFQVRLPRDTRRIIGLEYHARKIYGEPIGIIFREAEGPAGDSSFFRKPNKLIGHLSLSNFNCAGVIYQGDLSEDRNTEYLEGITALQLEPKPWVQSSKREEVSFCVSGNIIEGLFKDRYGIDEYEYLEYELSLYFWIEKCSNDN